MDDMENDGSICSLYIHSIVPCCLKMWKGSAFKNRKNCSYTRISSNLASKDKKHKYLTEQMLKLTEQC